MDREISILINMQPRCRQQDCGSARCLAGQLQAEIVTKLVPSESHAMM
jgi:hypothetical protein